MSGPNRLEVALSEARVLICAGTGGVGKTTIAASLAIQAARSGRRTLVLTIDPARRLASALGLEALGARPTPVRLPKSKGMATLHAMMLDPKPTFDRLITKLTEDEAARQRILENGIYQHFSQAFAGSADYAAMEQVHELVHSEDYDLIVVDTPPADHALDFLRAPKRLREFLESRFVSALVRPALSAGRFGMRLFARPLHRMFGLLERIAGGGFLDDLREFLNAIDGLSEGFRERAQRVEEVLLGEQTGFILVSSPQAGANASTIEFLDELDAFRVQLVGIVVNRMRPWQGAEAPQALLDRCDEKTLESDRTTLAAACPKRMTKANRAKAADEIIERVLAYARICAADEEKTLALANRASRHRVPCLPVPELPRELDHLEGLLEIGLHLRPPSSESGKNRRRKPSKKEQA
ncbi:MAG: ArsA family ATPase [Myxococcota bacterium]